MTPAMALIETPRAEPALDAWIGRTEEAEDSVSPHRVEMLAATLDLGREARAAEGLCEGGPLPALWHWLAFLPDAPMSGLGPDGHPVRGGFLPPVALERRMWAGGRLVFRDEIRIGERILRRSEILKVAEKTGAAARMVFVTVGHCLSTPRGPAVEEEQDIVYVAMPDRFRPPPESPLPAAPVWEEPVAIDTVRLFRFSAATFNAHRIHFDLPYATEVEKYPGLVVHGPLQAMLLMQAARRRRGGARPAGFRFRGVRPLFHFDRPRLVGLPPEGREETLATVTAEGHLCMQACVTWPG
jgi:3-methylfumaryl-CoA hydratase